MREPRSLSALVREAGLLASDAVMDRLAAATGKRAPTEPAPPVRSTERGSSPEWPSAGGDSGRSLLGAGEAIAARGVAAVVSRVDVDAIIDRIDVQRIVDRIDVDEVVQRVDVDRVVDSVDPNRLLARVDIDEVVDRVEVGEVAADVLDEIDIGEIIRDSTATIGSDAVEGFRYQAMVADDLVAQLVDRVLRRRDPRRTALDVRQG